MHPLFSEKLENLHENRERASWLLLGVAPPGLTLQ